MSAKLNIFGSGYIKENLNCTNLTIKNFLRVFEVIGVENIEVRNTTNIAKDLNIIKTIDGIDIYKYPAINIVNNINSESFKINDILNCNYFTTFNTLNCENNTDIILRSNFVNVIIFNTLTSIKNKCISDYSNTKLEVTESNSTNAKNIIIHKNVNTYDLDVTKNGDTDLFVNCNNLNTVNMDVLNNTNCNTYKNIKINNLLRVEGNVNVAGNTTIRGNLILNGILNFKQNSLFMLPKFSQKPIQYTLNDLDGSLRFNDIKNTIELYSKEYNKESGNWKSISTLHTTDYKSNIHIYEDDNNNTANNITFIQNNDVSIEFNNSNNLNIYKNDTFTLDVNLKGIINYFNYNLNIQENLITNKHLSGKLLILGNNSNNNINNGYLKINKDINVFQLYHNNFGKLNFHSLYNGINIKETDNIDLFLKNNKIELNTNYIHFIKNINIDQNLDCNQLINISKNINIQNSIIYNKKAYIKYNGYSLNSYVVPNYNHTNFKLFNINEINEIENKLFTLPYISSIFYTKTNSSYTYLLNDYILDNNFINNNYVKFIYLTSENTNILINKLLITKIIKNNQHSESEIELKNIKDNYEVLIHVNDILVYDSKSSITEFVLEKNSYYTIQIRLNDGSINHLFVRLKGLYYSDFLYNNKELEFLYNIDSNFNNDVTFSKNINIKKNIDINSLQSDKYFTNKLHVNSLSNTLNNNLNNIFSVNNDYITINDSIGIGTISNNSLTIKNKYNSSTLDIQGNAHIKNMDVINNINITNNINSNYIFYQNLNTENILCTNTILYNNINCNFTNTHNILLNNNSNLLSKTITKNLQINKVKYPLDTFVHNVNILDKSINYMDTFKFNNNNGMSINSDIIYNNFSIGDEIKPNLSISSNGYTIVNCNMNGFMLNDLNLLDKIKTIENYLD